MHLLSARSSKKTIYCHFEEKHFLKFEFDKTFTVDINAGGIVHKLMHCSGEYALIFRNVLPSVQASVERVVGKYPDDTSKIVGKWDGNTYEYEFDPSADGVIKTSYFSDKLQMWLCVKNLGVTMQQKVECNYIGLYAFIKLETPHR